MTVSVLFLLTVLLSNCDAAPATYDQRQDGNYNVHAQLDNFLIVIATSGSNSVFNNFAAQILEFKNDVSRHVSKKDKDVDSSRYEIEETHERSKEPYRVEIVHIEKPEEISSKSENVPSKVEEKLEQLEPSNDLKKVPESKDLSNLEDDEKESRSLWKHDGRAVQGKLGKVEKSEGQKAQKNSDALRNLEKIEEAGRSRVVMENVNQLKTPGQLTPVDLGRPGQSLKKELSSKKVEVEEKLQTKDREEVDVETLGSKPEGLSRIGDRKIECGPGQSRDNAGTCQIAAAN